MCLDRVKNGLLPACVKACPTGAMNFGDRDAMLELAESRLGAIKDRYPQAQLLDAADVNVVYLTAYDPLLYHEFSIASNTATGVTRQVALRRMIRPLITAVSQALS
jgi:formate dehydrogenase iron-sulfur subunit